MSTGHRADVVTVALDLHSGVFGSKTTKQSTHVAYVKSTVTSDPLGQCRPTHRRVTTLTFQQLSLTSVHKSTDYTDQTTQVIILILLLNGSCLLDTIRFV